ncbi:DUF4760 domain-containing protein [Vreelandella lutescens]|uniref:DUF4760 domain-containing protein n=1 Tax=Vreelandella lutescens TaxID=1602943 RepID=A0ABQ1PCN7_9GAMM|nr:DUF4760 domain-containing protein [Halomonas lutescens]GGC94663.1 hypothetical protein GCM10011382_26390 [Halomonas lutescens]
MFDWLMLHVTSLEPDAIQAILTSVGITVAVISVLSVKSTAQKKQTADYLLELRTDIRLEKSIQRLRQLHVCENTNLLTLGRENKADNQDAQDLRYLLNHFERLSVGIQDKIYNEKMIKKSQYSTIVRTYERSSKFIEGVRENADTAYQEFEWLIKRWRKSPLKKKKQI